MKMHTLLVTAILLPLVAAATPLPAAAAKLKVWTEAVAYKVQPTTASGTGTSIALEGAKDSYEAGQVIVRASGGALSGVNMSAGPLTDGAGHSIAASNITFYKEHFIDFTKISVMGGNRPVPKNSPTHDGRIPDPLIPFIDPYSGAAAGAPFNVASGLNQPVWVDVYIPRNTATGRYTGKITVKARGQASVSVPVTVTVWDFILPDMRTVTTYFILPLDPIVNYHSRTYDCSGSNCWLSWNRRARTIAKRYEEMAHVHRCDPGQNFIPDPGNGCKPPSDWTAYDAAMKPYMTGSYWRDKVPGNRVDTPFAPGVDWGLESACSQSEYTALAKSWAAHLKSNQWFDRAVVYSLDEPESSSFPAIAKNSKWMQTGDPDWKTHIMDTTAPFRSNVKTLNPALGIYCVALAWYDDWWIQGSNHPYGRAEWQTLFAKNIKLWFYESNAQGAPYPTYATNTLLGMEPRIMKWGSWYEHASGFLYWSMTTYDAGAPWGPTVAFGKTGDGVLMYPGNHNGLKAPEGSPSNVKIDGPVPSYRLKMIRAGMQDWALLFLADRKGLTDYARTQVARVYGQLGGCTWSGCTPVNGSFFWKKDDKLMMTVRHNIAEAITAATSTGQTILGTTEADAEPFLPESP